MASDGFKRIRRAGTAATLAFSTLSILNAQTPERDTVRIVKFSSNEPRFSRIETVGLPSRLSYAVRARFRAVKTMHELPRASERALSMLRRRGYAGAQAVAIKADTAGARRVLRVEYDLGRRFFFENLELRDCPAAIYDATTWQRLRQKPYSGATVRQKLSEALKAAQNRGFAFAQIENVEARHRLSGDSVLTTLVYRLNSGPEVVIGDSVQILGDIREKNRFVVNLTRLRPGELYRRDVLERLPSLLDNTPYYQNAKVETLFYQKNGRYFFIPQIALERKKSNRFDVLAGLLPPRSGETTFDFTALADFMLVSGLRLGEIFTLRYEKLTRSSQRLDLSYLHPYLLRLPLKLELRFFLFKQDSLFLTRKIEPAVHYELAPSLSVKGYYRHFESSLLNARPYRTVKFPPPPAINARSQLFGWQLTFDNTDFRLNPSRGFHLSVDYAVGPKLLKKTPGLDSLDYSRLVLRQLRQEATAVVRIFLPVRARQTLVLGATGHRIFLRQYFDNDLTQIGGPKSLRGFNENQFYTHFFLLGTAEYRLRLGREGYAGLFVEGGFVGYRSMVRPETRTWPRSVGGMFYVKTPAGLVGLTYAVGATDEVPFQPLRGRIHIGWAAGF
ncbi:MAG: BamA/TamA family outer membrane protein [Bacteroidia bacterium]|nr:BamA/TamA family outer membrane protein [Bacteroidia bacterium]